MEMLTIINWCLASLFGLFFLKVATRNGCCCFKRNLIHGKRNTPPLDFLDGITGITVLLVAPVGSTGQGFHYSWLHLILGAVCILPVSSYVVSVLMEQRECRAVSSNESPE